MEPKTNPEPTATSRVEARIATYTHRGSKTSLFRPFTFSALPSQITCILGASGTGKTTLLRILLGEPAGSVSGQVTYYCRGESLSARAAAAAGLIGALFQGNSLIPWKNVEANLELPHRLNGALSPPGASPMSDMLEALGLRTSVLSQFPHQLSLGMRQRIHYARLLLYSPSFLLLDEPFLGLDPLNIDRIARSLREFVTSRAACSVMVTHDLTIATRMADTFYYLSSSGSLKPLAEHASEQDLLDAFSEDMHETDPVS
jgi:NitT/TauT family transport system ATP-binding protein